MTPHGYERGSWGRCRHCYLPRKDHPSYWAKEDEPTNPILGFLLVLLLTLLGSLIGSAIAYFVTTPLILAALEH